MGGSGRLTPKQVQQAYYGNPGWEEVTDRLNAMLPSVQAEGQAGGVSAKLRETVLALEALADKMGERCGDHCPNNCTLCTARNDLRLILHRSGLLLATAPPKQAGWGSETK